MAGYLVLKYVVMADNLGIEKPYIFSGLDQHSDVAFCLPGKAVSGGFIAPGTDGILICYGESISLNLKSRPEQDAKLINKFLHGHDDY